MPHPRGLGDVPPKTKTRGKLPTLKNPPPSGTQNLGGPSANEGGQKLRVEGARPHPRGLGGCAPKIKTRGKLPTLINLPPSGTQNLGEPSANEGGQKLGVEGAMPPPRGLGGCAPKTKTRG